MATCVECGSTVFVLSRSDGLIDGRCKRCHQAHLDGRGITAAQLGEEHAAIAATRAADKQRLILTTETAHNLPVTDRLGIVTAEVVVGMHFFKDLAAGLRDTFGGRSKVMQQELRDARNMALDELKGEAIDLGADAVVGVDLDYSEISGAGKSMLFLVASGTAVKLGNMQ